MNDECETRNEDQTYECEICDICDVYIWLRFVGIVCDGRHDLPVIIAIGTFDEFS